MENKELCEMGVIGVGVMGNNLLLNMADHGFTVAGFDRNASKIEKLQSELQHSIRYTADLKVFIESLKRPRAIMLLVPAGKAVDGVIQELLPYLEKGDLIIDAGNSYFKDTDARTLNLNSKGFQFLGIGISGGEEGARLGPSIMPGGSKEAYDRIHLVLEAIAAKVNSEPCVTYLGRGSSGHFVKMVHNGIEYGIMQLIAETYDFMKRGLNLNNKELQEVYAKWNQTELNSYLVEITSHIFEKNDDKTDKALIDEISGVAKQLGTGMWTAETAMELQIPTPTINIAVTMRDLSMFEKERQEMNSVYHQPIKSLSEKPEQLITDLGQALFVGMIFTYAQGMSLLRVASEKYDYGLELQSIARIWRGGCIIRSALLKDISHAFQINKDLTNLLLDTDLSQRVKKNKESLRKIVSTAALLGIPTPGLMASLSYLDAFSSAWLPSNLIQAQRDYFGSHSYERIDMKGTFHTEWEEK